MAKFVYVLMPKWSKGVPFKLAERCYGSWREAPICPGRHMETKGRKCHPKEGACPANLTDCPTIDWPECDDPIVKTPPHLFCCCDHRLTEKPCKKAAKKTPKQAEMKPFKSMWEVCGIEHKCLDVNPRMDETHYVPSDASTRLYTQTWESCKPVIRNRKVCCINEMCMLPPLEKRSVEECPPTAKEQDSEQLKVEYKDLRNCLENVMENPNTKRVNKCRKIVMPCCRNVRKSTKCHRNRQESKCEKDHCPHPSFSECDHPSVKQVLTKECECSHFPPQCEASRFLVRKRMFKIPPPLPAWPIKERPK